MKLNIQMNKKIENISIVFMNIIMKKLTLFQ
jgi:hypothetical protein